MMRPIFDLNHFRITCLGSLNEILDPIGVARNCLVVYSFYSYAPIDRFIRTSDRRMSQGGSSLSKTPANAF